MTACMTCSIITMVMPRSAMARMVGTMAASSVGLSPAKTSSSSRRPGSVASARASSSRFRPATVRLAAGLSSSSARPTATRLRGRVARRRHVRPRKVRTDGDIFTHGQTREWLNDLEGASDTATRKDVWRCPGDFGAVVNDPSFIRRQKSRNYREQGSFAGAVGPNQSRDMARPDIERSFVDSEQPTEAL